MNLIRYFVSLLILFLTIEIGAYRILGIFPLRYLSHNFLFHALMKGLAKRGHEVDVISYYEYKDTHKNYRTILNLATLDKNTLKSTFDSITEATSFDTDPIKDCATMLGIDVCEIMAHEKMQKIIKNPPKDPAYDLIITEVITFIKTLNKINS